MSKRESSIICNDLFDEKRQLARPPILSSSILLTIGSLHIQPQIYANLKNLRKR
jgi:hypothetical protein